MCYGIALLALTLAMAGCQAPRLNPGRVISVGVGTHAGWFRRVNGRWPADLAELARLDCPRIDDSYPPDPVPPGQLPERGERLCNFLAELPYEVEMRPRAQNLRLSIRGKKGIVVCQMTVLAPTRHSARELSPMIRIRMFGFDCLGEGEDF